MTRITPAFLRTIDWSTTPVGPIDAWPRSLQSYVSMMLALPTPAILFWGPAQTQIYNDGYAVIMGPRHPQYFGAPYRQCWPDTYPVIIPWMRAVLDEGKFCEVARAPFTVTRHGFPEEAYFTFTFSPLFDDEGRIAGIYQPVVEMTDTVLSERRAETLRALTARRDVLPLATSAFDANPRDVPWAGIYLWNDSERRLRVSASSGFASPEECEEKLAPLAAAALAALSTNQSAVVPTALPGREWPEPVREAFVTPIRRASSDAPLGVIVFGVSPRLRFDAPYRAFFEAVARELGTSIAAQRAEQLERDLREREQWAHRDLSAAKEAQARRLALLFEHAPVGIAVLRGPERVFEVANSTYALLVANRPLLHKPLHVALPELAGQGIFELVDRVFATGEPFIGRSIRLVLDVDGTSEEHFFDFSYEPVPDDTGKVESIIVIVYDVTELSRARRDAESANRAKDEFFAILGHELRNPLAPIATALHLMRLRGDHANVKERTIIERQVGHIMRLVDDLLDVSRITRGQVDLTLEPTELHDVVVKAIETASPLLEQRRHHVDLAVPTHGLVVDVDALRFPQIVANLLTNAAKYTEPGGHVRIAAEPKGDRVALHVTDNGVGIAPELLARVFEPFAQEQQTLDRAQGGLGLGLTIVANLVKLHGGTVAATSQGRGHGSTFSVELPLSGASSSATARGPKAELALRTPTACRVLVVDDNEDAAELLAVALGLAGYVTRVAHNGAEALRVAEQYRPDVALLDIGLPVMDGYELAGRLRSGPGGGQCKLVALTGYGQDSDRRRSKAAGFDAHLVKPVQIEAVTDLISSYCADADANR